VAVFGEVQDSRDARHRAYVFRAPVGEWGELSVVGEGGFYSFLEAYYRGVCLVAKRQDRGVVDPLDHARDQRRHRAFVPFDDYGIHWGRCDLAPTHL
jgi:hypothetical protein